MQTANCYVQIGGDSGTTVPKYEITVSEIAVLRAIHGPDSVTDIEPTEDVERTDRQEIARLHQIYSRSDTIATGAVGTLFPGAAARAFQSLDELDIPEEFFKAESRARPKPAAKPVKVAKSAEVEAPVSEDVEKTLAEEDKLFD